MSTADPRFTVDTDIVDRNAYDRSVERFRQQQIALPTFAQLTEPSTIPAARRPSSDLDRNAADPRNLFRVHWYNGLETGDQVALPEHLVVPPAITGIESPVVVVFGDRFPLIGAHKVLAAYSCLVPRVVSGQFDPTHHRAVWPSTGNYARGGVAISRLMGCRGVAVLPENMSRERFEWLDRWVTEPADIIRTPGSESNVKEIYDECALLATDPENFIINQFSEFSNHIGHYEATGRALGHVFETLAEQRPSSRLAAFVSASGSAGTLGAGDRLKDDYGTRIVAAEALECPTMLYNGFGEHNIQGIGDKHIPLIHNVTNTDVVVGISDRATDELNVLFTSAAGGDELRRRGVDDATIAALPHFGFSSIANLLAAIKAAKALGLGVDDVVMTVATDGSELYRSEREALVRTRFGGSFDAAEATEVAARHLDAIDTSDTEVLDEVGRRRIFNLGYFTWVEQQGVAVEDFERRRNQEFWSELRTVTPTWDQMIEEFNARTGVLASP